MLLVLRACMHLCAARAGYCHLIFGFLMWRRDLDRDRCSAASQSSRAVVAFLAWLSAYEH